MLLDEDEKRFIMRNSAVKNLLLVRQGLNRLFSILGEERKDVINNINFNDITLDEKDVRIKNKIITEGNYGIKFAVAVKYEFINYKNIDLCKKYLELNNVFHPKIIPFNTIISSINALEEVLEKDPEYKPAGINMTKSLYEDFKTEILMYKNKF